MNFKNFKTLMMTTLIVLTLTNYSHSELVLVSYNKNGDFYFFDTRVYDYVEEEKLTMFKILSTHENSYLLSDIVNLGPDDEDKYFKSTSLMLAAKCESQETMIIEEVYFSGILGDGETVYISEEMGKFYPIEAYPFPPSNAINYVCDYKVD